jgi:hypothetical protein
MQTNQLELIQPSLELESLVDAEACARELKRCADAADQSAATAQGCAELAIRHAWYAGAVCNRAKEIIPHGEFQGWLEANSDERGLRTLQKWMKLAKTNLNAFLSEASLKGLQDAYIATGILPDAEPKQDTGEEKEKPLFTLNFKTQYHHPSEWSRDAARDFLYEFDRIAKLAMTLKTEFGL